MTLDKNSLKNSDFIYDYSSREIFARVYALEAVLKHLDESENDSRKKERMRVQIAKNLISKQIKIGHEIYDPRKDKRNDSKRS